MFARVIAVIGRRPAIAGPSFACAMLLALVPALAGILGAIPLVALLLTWDSEVALSLMPDLTGLELTAIAMLATVGFVVWRRLDAVLIYMTGPENGSAWVATEAAWVKVALLHIEALLTTALGAGLLTGLIWAGGGAVRGGEAVLLLCVILILRTAIRVYLTLASRYVIFEGAGVHQAWSQARALVRAEKAQIVMAWLTLAAAGVCIWLLGPLTIPIVRDTAFDYPVGSSFTVAWEGARLLIGVPLEAVLMIVSAVVWTSVAWEPQPAAVVVPLEGRWRIRLLAGTTALIVLANGLATMIDVRHRSQEDRLQTVLGVTEIRPEDAQRRAATSPTAASQSYAVDAHLDGTDLVWTTTLTYRNTTGVPLNDMVLSVWPAAYARKLREIPLASDLIAADVNGTFAAKARPGTLDVTAVSVRGAPAGFELEETSLEIGLSPGLEPGGTVDIEIALDARLPEFPERFGRWDKLILLGNWIPTVAPYTTGWRRDEFGNVGDPFVSVPADYHIEIELDDSLGVVGSGNLVDVTDSAGLRTWAFDAPASRDAAFAIGPFIRGIELPSDGGILRCWYPAEARSEVLFDCLNAVEAFEAFSEMFGELPFDELDVVETAGVLGGMEYPGVVFVARDPGGLETLPLLGELFDYAGFDETVGRHVLAHEIAHQWWYATVGSDQVQEPFLDEALAEMSARLLIGDQAWRMANLISDVDPSPSSLRASISDFETNEEYSEAIYQGGSELLMRLRAQIGVTTFAEIIKRWYLTQQLSQGTVSELLEVVETIGGEAAIRYLDPPD